MKFDRIRFAARWQEKKGEKGNKNIGNEKKKKKKKKEREEEKRQSVGTTWNARWEALGNGSCCEEESMHVFKWYSWNTQSNQEM